MGLISRVSSRTYRSISKHTEKKTMADKQKAFRAKNIRGNSPAELEAQLTKYRQDLANLRVATVTSGGASKLGKIHDVRKSIAKVLTVINQSQKTQLQKFYRGKKFKPVDLRPRKTRALRKRLNKHEEGLKNLKTLRRERRTAIKNFALKA